MKIPQSTRSEKEKKVVSSLSTFSYFLTFFTSLVYIHNILFWEKQRVIRRDYYCLSIIMTHNCVILVVVLYRKNILFYYVKVYIIPYLPINTFVSYCFEMKMTFT